MQVPKQYRSARRRVDDRRELSDKFGHHLQLHSCDLKNTRELRTLLLEAAYELNAQPDLASVQIDLHSCTLATQSVKMEMEQFRGIVQPTIAARIILRDVRSTTAQKEKLPLDTYGSSTVVRPPAIASQEAVVAYLLQRHLQFLSGVGVNSIADATGASLPTVYKVLAALRHCIEKDPEDRSLRLRYFEQSDWLHWMQRASRLSSVYFIDRSGAPRSAHRLANALSQLQRSDLAIGGLMGAMHHLPALDATSAPQLDILVHGSRSVDLSFITALDPGLERYEGRTDLANVVVHFVDRPASLFAWQGKKNWGALPDCIANMHKAGLMHQVFDTLRLIKTAVESHNAALNGFIPSADGR